MKRPNIVCGWGSAPDPAGPAHDVPLDYPIQGTTQWRGTPRPQSTPLDAFDRCSWTFVET